MLKLEEYRAANVKPLKSRFQTFEIAGFKTLKLPFQNFEITVSKP
jgi:hypothetical protein